MLPFLNPYGLRDGCIISAEDLDETTEFGRRCNCICPKCGKPLIARIKGKKRKKHFAHDDQTVCSGAYESAVHRLVKEVIEEGTGIKLPHVVSSFAESGYFVLDSIVRYKAVLSEGEIILPDIGKTEVEKELGNIRPDLIIEHAGHKLIIEVLVSHAVDEEKKQLIKEIGISCIEIDFSYYWGTAIDKARIRNGLAGNDPKVRIEWVYNKKQYLMDQELRSQISNVFHLKTNLLGITTGKIITELGTPHHVCNSNTPNQKVISRCPIVSEIDSVQSNDVNENNEFMIPLDACINCNKNNGLINKLESEELKLIICSDKGQADVHVICSLVIDYSSKCQIPSSEEQCKELIKKLLSQFGFVSSPDPNILAARNKALEILIDRFNRKAKSPTTNRKTLNEFLLFKEDFTKCCEDHLTKLILSSDSTYDTWVSNAWKKEKNQLPKIKTITEFQRKILFDDIAEHIWEKQLCMAREFYSKDVFFRENIDSIMKQEAGDFKNIDSWIYGIVSGFRKNNESYTYHIIDESVSFDISIVPLLESLYNENRNR